MVQEMGAFTQKCGFPCIKSERRNSMWHGESKQRGKVRREGPVNHRIWPGIEACPCGRVDRFSILNGKSQCSKRWLGVVFGLCYSKNDMKLLLQELSTEIWMMKLILFWWENDKLVEKGIIKQGNLNLKFIFTSLFFLYFQILINNSLQNYSGRSWVVEVWVWMSPILAWIYRWALISLS